MNKYVLLVVLIIAVVGCKNNETNKNEPLFSVLQDTLDFGTIKMNDSIESSFIIYNIGNDTLKILDSGTSCGCTVASISNTYIPPADSAFVNIVYTSENDKGVVY